MANRSPWIHQLDRDRVTVSLAADREADVAVIGGGIAGISTAFFTLKYTDKSVIMLEAGRLAHGATGHNAGQLTSYFERPYADLVEEFGPELARDGQAAIEGAWELVDEMYNDAGLTLPLARFLGHAGITNLPRILSLLRDNKARRDTGLMPEEFLIADSARFLKDIPRDFDGLYRLASQQEIIDRVEAKDERFVACISARKGVMNSALFTQEVAQFLLKKYSGRFSLFEHTRVRKVVLKDDHALLDAGNATVDCSRVVLCTNGFEDIQVIAPSGLEIDARFHHSVVGVVGFMSAYLAPYRKPPIALSYLMSEDSRPEDPYFYLTRRQYEYDGADQNLVSIGGPELVLEDRTEYLADSDYPEEAHNEIDRFVKDVYEGNPHAEIDYAFRWHGLMGYTANGVRMVGPDPQSQVLMYNLGCNGIGILPSLFGARTVARHLAGEILPPSMFDVKAQRGK
jgi:glycine/D-amino acid oxidase-like deaminating enzyme